MKESNIEKYLKNEVEKMGGWCIKFWPMYLAGFPDRIVLFQGAVCQFVELKSEGKNPTKLQMKMIERLKSLGFRVEVIDSKIKVDKYLSSL